MTVAALVSVIVCTSNRARPLTAACDALFELDYPLGRWELLIVDNAPIDDTAEVARS